MTAFFWPWPDDDDRPFEHRVLLRLRHIADQNDQILRLLTLAPASPDAVALLAIGVPMPVTLDQNQTTDTYTYTETRGGVIVTPNIGTPAWSIDDPAVLAAVDNGDGTFTITRVAPAGGTTNVNLQVTLPDGTVLTATPDTATVDAQLPDAVELVPGPPA